jgi:hypothetical protein
VGIAGWTLEDDWTLLCRPATGKMTLAERALHRLQSLDELKIKIYKFFNYYTFLKFLLFYFF